MGKFGPHRFQRNGRDIRSREYQAWAGMKQRAAGASGVHDRKYYAERGIKMDPAWQDFFVFLVDMGPHPGPGYSIDRIDNDGDYTKSNCRWATLEQQRRNTQRSKLAEDDIPKIFDLVKAGVSGPEIARRFNLRSRNSIHEIVAGRSWRLT